MNTATPNSNLFSEMLRKIDPQVFGQVLQQAARGEVDLTNPKQQILSPTIEADRIRRQQQDMDQRQESLRGVDHGMREFAPIAGALKGIAAQMQGSNDKRELDELYASHLASEQAERDRQGQARALEQQAAREAEERKYQRKIADEGARYRRGRADKSADAAQASKYAIAEEEAKQRAIGVNRAPAKPSQQENLQAIINQGLSPEQERQALLMAGGDSLVKDRDAQAVSLDESKSGQARAQAGIDLIDGLLNAKPERGPMDFLPPVAAYNAITGNSKTPLEQAAGAESAFPTLPGSPASNAEASLERLRGMNFLEVIQEMKGSGTITEVEGQKGENAMAQIQLGQSDESIKQGLRELREVLAPSGLGDSGGGSGLKEGQVADNPQTGETIVFRNGKWVTQ